MFRVVRTYDVQIPPNVEASIRAELDREEADEVLSCPDNVAAYVAIKYGGGDFTEFVHNYDIRVFEKRQSSWTWTRERLTAFVREKVDCGCCLADERGIQAVVKYVSDVYEDWDAHDVRENEEMLVDLYNFFLHAKEGIL